MASNADDRLREIVLDHITSIAARRCSLSESAIDAEPDPVLREILAGLLTLHEELSFGEARRAAAERRSLELSTPILEVGRGVLVLPLIGVIDLARSEQMIERALDSVASKRAGVLVIDVTGVADLDAGVIGKLGETIRAVALLGARTILTGISPANAFAWTAHDTPLGDALIRRTLGDALDAAFRLTAE